MKINQPNQLTSYGPVLNKAKFAIKEDIVRNQKGKIDLEELCCKGNVCQQNFQAKLILVCAFKNRKQQHQKATNVFLPIL